MACSRSTGFAPAAVQLFIISGPPIITYILVKHTYPPPPPSQLQDAPVEVQLFVKYVPLTADATSMRSALTGKVSPAVSPLSLSAGLRSIRLHSEAAQSLPFHYPRGCFQ